MLSFFQSEMDSLIAFAKKPRDAQELTTFQYRIRVFGFAFLLNIVLILLASLGISALELAGIIDSENHQVQLLLKTFHPALVFVFAVFLGPILEEFVFRFGLRYNKLSNFYNQLRICIVKRRNLLRKERFYYFG